jgi:hypothetical protein
MMHGLLLLFTLTNYAKLNAHLFGDTHSLFTITADTVSSSDGKATSTNCSHETRAHNLALWISH